MDSVYFNKIAGAVLASLLLLVGLHTFIKLLYPKGDANLGKGTIVVTANPVPGAGQPAAQQAAAQPEKADPPADVELASANPEAGATAAKKCATCHLWDKSGKNNIGPSLYGVVGRDVGSHPGFTYSPAMKSKGGKWTFEELYRYLKNPKEAVPGNKMAFAGVPSPQERANIIAFLDQQSDNPIPLPKKQ